MALIDLAALITILGGGFALLWLAWKIKLRWWPGLVLRLLLLILVGIAVGKAIENDQDAIYSPEILILDRSESISEEGRFDSQVFATVWKSLRPNRQIIVFGATTDFVLSDDWPEIIRSGSDIAEALNKAGIMLDREPGRVIIATDGLVDNPNDVNGLLGQIKAAGGVVDYVPLEPVKYTSDVFVGQLKGALSVWSGVNFPLYLPVFATNSSEAILQIYVNGLLYKENVVQINKGESIIQVILPAGDPGVLSVEAKLVVEGDQFEGNNTANSSVRVFAQPNILFVTKKQESSNDLVTKLDEQGSEVTVIAPDQFPTSIEMLKSIQVIMVHDVLAQDFNYEQMQAIKLHVLELGKGLVFLGGRNSYTLGGYQNSVLEPLMPVKLVPPDRVQRVPVTFLLVLDRSGSMAGDRDTEIAPIDLTREAAMRAIETLRSDDYLGVLTFSGTINWDVELRKVGEGLDLRVAQDKVSQIVALGGTFMYQALEEAINQMVMTDTTDYPHILLMSDGVSGDGSLDEFLRLVRYAANQGITISTIALGLESDPETLSQIAAVGGGRFYQVLNPSDLPSVMISESKAVQAENVQEGRTNLILGIENHPILAGFRLDELPLLDGYLATQTKSDVGAEDVLVSGNYGDPLLSVWQVGLGHVAAWMGDLGEQWSPGMRGWEDQGVFWQQVARYTLPDPLIGQSEVNLSIGDTNVRVELKLNETDEKLHSLKPKWITSRNGHSGSAYTMTQISGGVYELVFPIPEMGAYTGIIQLSEESENKDLLVPFAVNYPDEWRFEPAETGKKQISSWVEISEGSEISFEEELENSQEFGLEKGINWLGGILIVLIIVWPVEIAVRRWMMPWRRP